MNYKIALDIASIWVHIATVCIWIINYIEFGIIWHLFIALIFSLTILIPIISVVRNKTKNKKS